MTPRNQQFRVPWASYFCIIIITPRILNHNTAQTRAYIPVVYALYPYPYSLWNKITIRSFVRSIFSKQRPTKGHKTKPKPGMCLRVLVLYQCGCNATRTFSEYPEQTYEIWSCHGYTPSCYVCPLSCVYILANDCGRPTCKAVRNYWGWRVHHGLSAEATWLLFAQLYDRWYAAGANDQALPVAANHPHDLAPHRWDYRYPRYDQPGFICNPRRHYSTRIKNTANAPQPPWPVLDVPNPDPDLNIDYENYPTLDKRVLEEDDPRPLGLGREEDLQPPGPLGDEVGGGPRRLTIGQLHMVQYYHWACSFEMSGISG
ncbi:hypothetical protein B0T13DRAFT_449361 [Neurospora crassa]|nr:hypothetical protein B0T13DRAFT_449361 [Neurospora crassa]